MNQRVALFLPALAGGGAERVMLHIASGIASAGIPVDLVLARAVGPYMKQVPSNVRLIDLKARQTLLGLPALTNYVKRERPAAVLSALNHANITAACAVRRSGARVRMVMSVHNTLSISRANAKSWKDKLIPMGLRAVHGWADGIVAVSNGVADDFSEATGIARNRVQVIYNPVVADNLPTLAAAEVSHPWMQLGQPPVLLSVGRMTPQKDFGNLLRAFRIVRDQRDVRLIILGDGEEREQLKSLAGELGVADAVDFPGFVENPYAYMSRAGVFVLSSQWEGLPTVLIEAMACGAPVVSTDCPSGPNEILAAGKYGELVPTADPPALASGVLRTLDVGRRPPPIESWEPYRISVATQKYIDMLTRGAAKG